MDEDNTWLDRAKFASGRDKPVCEFFNEEEKYTI
jgi:hypothetical protein